MSTLRAVVEQIQARKASDGDGVKLLRVFGGERPERFDPFLMLDEFGSDEAADYIGGFPAHPHRGFETVTYMLQGKMEHRDHMGNVGLINDSDVQWMTAGRGIIHSEMPRQTEGRMRGFQLWVNLPAKNKLKPAHYEDVPGDKIPLHQLDGAWIKAIAGETAVEDTAIDGYFQVPDTDAVMLDVVLEPNKALTVPVPDGFNVLLYTYEGRVELGENRVATGKQVLSRLAGEGAVSMKNAGSEQARLLFLAGKPLQEPIVQYGPFVMNTVAEVEQAIRDYQEGTLASG